jgi:hypothetical protein
METISLVEEIPCSLKGGLMEQVMKTVAGEMALYQDAPKYLDEESMKTFITISALHT